MPISPLHIAIVDDDESICRAVCRLLRAAGMQAIGYGSAETFLSDNQHCFDCLLLDIQLGGMSGIELALWLAAEGRQAPVIFLTAFDDPETRSQAQRAGCAAYVRKSDPGQTVLDVIRRLSAC